MKLPRPWDSVITDEGIRFQLFFVKKTVRWQDIKAVHLVPFWKVMTWGLTRTMVSLGSPDLGKSVVVQTTSNYFILVNPTDKCAFVAMARNRLAEMGR